MKTEGDLKDIAQKVNDALAKSGLSKQAQVELLKDMHANSHRLEDWFEERSDDVNAATRRPELSLTKHGSLTVPLGVGAVANIPDQSDPAVSPGEAFALRIDSLIEELVHTPLPTGKKRGQEAFKRLYATIDEQALVHNATPSQVRYVKEMYAMAWELPGDDVTLEQFHLCKAWARAIEYIPNVHELVTEFEKRIAKCTWPASVKSANDVEALLMALGYCWSVFTLTPTLTAEERAELRELDVKQNLLGNLIGELSHTNDRMDLFVRKTKHVYGVDGLATFSLGWTESNFAKLEVGHKLAASLALTDIPEDVEVQAPWMAWSFVIPSGLFDYVLDDGDGHGREGSGKMEAFARALCFGSEIQYIVCSSGTILGPLDREKMLETADSDGVGPLLDALVRGACLALGDPEQCKKKQVGSSSSTKNRREGGAPDLSNARFMLMAPVQVDLRDALKAVQRGEKHKGGKLTVQFLVRGHPKNQAYGPNMSLRKRIWIQPFWKGPEESRVLLRNYVMKDERDETSGHVGLGPEETAQGPAAAGHEAKEGGKGVDSDE